jgi:hypothetical protein
LDTQGQLDVVNLNNGTRQGASMPTGSLDVEWDEDGRVWVLSNNGLTSRFKQP